MRVAAVHQFLPSLAPRDAIGAHTLAVQAIARRMGFDSEIYAEVVHPELAGRARSFRSYRGRRGRGDLLVYQSSIGSRVAEHLLRRPEPRVVNYHNITPASTIWRWHPTLGAELALGRRQLAELAPGTVHAIADSSFNRAELLALGYSSTSVAPIQMDLERPDPPTDGRRAARLALARRRAGGGADLLFVGRIVPNKAQHELVTALATYRRLYDRRARLHLVGGATTRSYLHSVADLAEQLGLGDAVDLPGPVSAADLLAYYRGCDAFVCLSDHEGFCLPLIEALHHGLPVLAYAAAAVPETLGGAGVLLEAKDPLTVSVALERVLNDGHLRQRLRAEAARRLAELSVERLGRVFEASLRQAVVLAEGGVMAPLVPQAPAGPDPVTAVHQLAPAYLRADAVGAHMAEIRRALRELGLESEIFVENLHRATRTESRLLGELPPGRPEDLLIYHLAIGSVAADVAFEWRGRLVVNYHNATPSGYFRPWFPPVADALDWALAQLEHLGRRAVLGIGDSAFNAAEMSEAGYPQVAVVPILFNPAGTVAEPDPKVAERLGAAKAASGGSDWLFVGRLAPNKAQQDLVKALAAYRSVYGEPARLHLVGRPAAESYQVALHRFIEAAGVGAVVEVADDGVSAEGLAAYYASADVLVSASEHEGFCVPLLEAMHHGVPIVAYSAAAVPETLGEAGLLVGRKDPLTLASAVHRVLTDGALRARLVAAGRARLREALSLERSRAQLMGALRPLLTAQALPEPGPGPSRLGQAPPGPDHLPL